MAELTYLTEGEKIEVLEETISKIGRLQAEISVAKKKIEQLNRDRAELLNYRKTLMCDKQ